MEKLFTLDETGKVTHLRGEPLPEGVMRIFSESEVIGPPRDTSWVLAAAHRFAKGLTEPSSGS